MSDESERIEADANNYCATTNAKTALEVAEKTRTVLMERMDRLDRAVNSLSQDVQQLTQKYHILMSKSFHGGSTVVD